MRITTDELVQLAPRLRPYLRTSAPGWPDIVEAADWLRHDLGVSKSLWGEACLAMGREKAAIALAIVSAKPAEHFTTSPGGYFYGMVAKAKAGHAEPRPHGVGPADRRRGERAGEWEAPRCGSPAGSVMMLAGMADAAATEVLAGLVERVTFHNPDNGFCVLRVKARGQRELVTVIGHAAPITAGEFVQASGDMGQRPRRMALQFRAGFLKASPPTTLEGIERYLGSGMIRGIGPVYARRLVRGLRRGGVRRDRAAARAAARGGGHRAEAGGANRRRLGRAEGDPRDHAVPARATASARRGRCGSTRPTAPTRCR